MKNGVFFQVFSGLGICINETVFNFFLLLASLSLRVLLPHSHHIFYGPLHTQHFAHIVGSLSTAGHNCYRA